MNFFRAGQEKVIPIFILLNISIIVFSINGASISTESGTSRDFSTDSVSLGSDVSRSDAVRMEADVDGVSDLSLPLSLDFEYSVVGEGGWSSVDGVKDGDGSFSGLAEDLSPGTEIEFRVFNENYTGNSVTATTRNLNTVSGSPITFQLGSKFLKWDSNGNVDGFNIYSNETGNYSVVANIEGVYNQGDSPVEGVKPDTNDLVCYYVKAFKMYDGIEIESDRTSKVCHKW